MNWQEAQKKDIAKMAQNHIDAIKKANEAILYADEPEIFLRALLKYMVPLIERSLGIPVTVEQLMPWREGSK